MKVALAFPRCYRRGGVERVMFECARFLLSSGHEVGVFAEEWEQINHPRISYNKVPLVSWPAFAHDPSFFSRCSSRLQQFKFDVLNTHGCICPTGGVQWVHSVHASWLERSKAFRKALSWTNIRQRLNPFHRSMLRLETEHFRKRNYRKLIVTTPRVREDLGRLYGVPEDDVVVIPNGFSPTEFSPESRIERRAAQRQQLKLRDDETALLFVANELDRKGYSTVLEAMRIMARKDVKLLVVGRVSQSAVMQQASDAGVADQVIACGPTTDVSLFHAASDIFVLPTQYEAFCLAILEALGSGVPVVTTDVPGARDAIRAGENGEIIQDPRSGAQLAAALTPLLNPDVRRHYHERAPESVSHHQWPNILRRYEQVLLANQ